MKRRRRYYVTTYDAEKQDFTPQQGVRTGPYSLFGLRKAIRKLRSDFGYEARRGDSAVYVHGVDVPTRRKAVSA